jgi:hypothetical protein
VLFLAQAWVQSKARQGESATVIQPLLLSPSPPSLCAMIRSTVREHKNQITIMENTRLHHGVLQRDRDGH